MKTNRVFFLFVFAAIIAIALFVINSAQAVANIPTTRAARADQADVLRWVAMGETYAGQPASVSSFDPKMSRDIGAARWQALGESYLKIASQARSVDAARWQALGEAYAKPASASSFDAKMSSDTSAARWQALGESYLKIASQVRSVDAARWQALGEAYMKNH